MSSEVLADKRAQTALAQQQHPPLLNPPNEHNKRTTGLLTLAVLTSSQQSSVEAASVLGFSVMGGVPHQALVATIGLELVRRGHTFTLLLHSYDELSHSRLAVEPFRALNLLKISGPSGVGTQEWRENILRDTLLACAAPDLQIQA